MGIDQFINKGNKRLKKNKEIKEVDIESKFCTHAKKVGCIALKLIMLNKRGFPDRTVLCPEGRVIFIEFKRKGKKLNGTQVPIKDLLMKLGFEYHVCDEIGQAEAILDDFL